MKNNNQNWNIENSYLKLPSKLYSKQLPEKVINPKKIYFNSNLALELDLDFLSEEEILNMVNNRNKARNEKNYKLADKIRNELLDKGILIEDKDGKTSWKIK